MSANDWLSLLSFRWRVVIASGFLFALNAFICQELFTADYLSHMGSIEAAFISLARYIRDQPGDLVWFPLWYCGIPFQNTYPPLLPFSTAGVAGLFDVSAARAYHLVIATLYGLGPVTLFWFAAVLSRRLAASFWAGLSYSLISPSVFLVDTIARDTPSLLSARRFQNLIAYGEGPHVSSLTLLPLALIAIEAACRKTTPMRVFLAAVSLASVVLTNWIGGVSLALATVALLLTRADAREVIRQGGKCLGFAVLAYVLVVPWVVPSTVAVIRRNSEIMEGDYPLGATQLLLAALIGAAVGMLWVGLRSSGMTRGARFACFFLLITFLIVVPYDRFSLFVIPQPLRYHLELGMALCLAAAFVGADLIDRARPLLKRAALLVLCLGAAWQVQQYRDSARNRLATVEIESSVEYQVARWLNEHAPDARIFTIGSVEYWLNAFTSNPQIGGGFGPGITNPRIPVVREDLWFVERDGPTSVLWLKAFGAEVVFVSGPRGREYYKAFRDPQKFEGLLPVLWREGGDVLYGMPKRSVSLAHVIRPGDAVREPPAGHDDIAAVRSYVEALEDPALPVAELEWQSRSRALIRAHGLQPSHLLSVQISYHPGWRAYRNGESIRPREDGLGLMLIEPQCRGECEIELIYDGGTEMSLAKAASAGAVLLLAGWFVVERRARRATAGRHDRR